MVHFDKLGGDGSGRTAADGERKDVRRAIAFTRKQWEKLRRLGGPRWVRRQIDNAPEPEPKSIPKKTSD